MERKKVNHTARRRIYSREKCDAAEQEFYLTFECMNTVGGGCGGVGWNNKKGEEVCCKRSS